MNKLMAIVTLAITALAAQAGHAAATLIENEQEPTRHPYQVFAQATCGFPGVCGVEFPTITTARTLVTHASCGFTLPTGGYVAYAFLNKGPEVPISNIPGNYLPPFVFSTYDGVINIGINAETYLFFETGDVPAISVVTANTAPSTIFCTLTGYYY